MCKYIKVADAKRLVPNYNNMPSIHKTGSLIGMRDKFGWDLKNVVQIGSYYYNTSGYTVNSLFKGCLNYGNGY